MLIQKSKGIEHAIISLSFAATVGLAVLYNVFFGWYNKIDWSIAEEHMRNERQTIMPEEERKIYRYYLDGMRGPERLYRELLNIER